MKSILFHIGSFNTGGAEKSLVTLLNTIPKDLYQVDVMVARKDGVLVSDVPECINIIETPIPYKCLSISPKKISFYNKLNFKLWWLKITGYVYAKFHKKFSVNQSIWKYWAKHIPVFDKHYDIAISYIEGIANYYIIDKIISNRKILWIHSEYDKLHYNIDFDREYFSKADAVVTISSLCRDNLVRIFPDLIDKFHVLENISNSRMIINQSLEKISDERKYFLSNDCNLLSVGRLVPPKNFRLAIITAKKLKDLNFKFSWTIIGEGPLRKELETLISNFGLNDCVHLIGLRKNPYPYMTRADIIVMTSIYEGKSIVIDEAKILCKAIVSVNYPTVRDNIVDQETGIITEMTPENLANGIIKLYQDKNLRCHLISNLSSMEIDNTGVIKDYLKLFDGE